MENLNTVKIDVDFYVQINPEIVVQRIIVIDKSGKEYSFVLEPMVAETINNLQKQLEKEEKSKVPTRKKTDK